MRISAIAQALEVDRTTAYRIVNTLQHAGFIERNDSTKEYKLAVAAFEVGSAYLRSTDLHSIARSVMFDLRGRIQESVHWAILSGDKSVCMDRIESPRGIGSTGKVGRAAPLNAGSAGKVLLAFQAPDVREKLLESSCQKRFTANTITSVQRMRSEIERIRSGGFCVSLGEGEEDMACIAAPVFNHAGQIVASLSTGGPIHRFSEKEFQTQAISEVKKAARLISEKLGCPMSPNAQDAA